MFFRTTKYLAFILVLAWNVFTAFAYAQTKVVEPVFKDTTQKLLERSRENILSSKRISDRQILLRRLSEDCRPNKKPLPPHCRPGNKPVSNKDNLIQKRQPPPKKTQVISSNSSSAVIQPASSAGGISIGVATMGLTAIVAVAGAAILTFFSVAGYGDDSSGSSSASSPTRTSN